MVAGIALAIVSIISLVLSIKLWRDVCKHDTAIRSQYKRNTGKDMTEAEAEALYRWTRQYRAEVAKREGTLN